MRRRSACRASALTAVRTPPHTGQTRLAPFSLRLSPDERERLERAAGGSPIGGYIKRQLLGDEQSGKRSRRASPARDPRLLAQLLAKLGASQLPDVLSEIADAARSGSFQFDNEAKTLIDRACADVRAMRLMLMRALGLRPDDDEQDTAPDALSPVFNGTAGEDRA